MNNASSNKRWRGRPRVDSDELRVRVDQDAVRKILRQALDSEADTEAVAPGAFRRTPYAASVSSAEALAARLLLGWSTERAAARFGVSVPTLQRMEQALHESRVLDPFKVRAVFEAAGVEFVRDRGNSVVRLKKAQDD